LVQRYVEFGGAGVNELRVD